MHLSNEKFLDIINHTPLVSIDLIIKNKDHKILLGLRNNKPAQNLWFVPGGRIRKNETIENAYLRIIKTETGLDGNKLNKTLLGVYDHIYNDNFMGVKEINTHYVVIAFEIQEVDIKLITPDSQHLKYEWWNTDAILNNVNVHQNTKNYFI